jgi:DNA-binding transcriptional MerR regulator
MASTGTYTAADLARLGGVSLRTVRFYIQEGLIDPPLGLGRGAHFTERHLHQLRRARALQAAGLDHTAIRAHADELERIVTERGLTLESAGRIWTSYAFATSLPDFFVAPREPTAGDSDDEDEEIDLADATRIPMAPGVELVVARGVPLPSPRRLVDLAMAVRRLFKPGKESK